MTGSEHAVVGLAVLLLNLGVGLWAVFAGRVSQAPTRPLAVGFVLSLVLLTFQIMLGADLWTQGLRPAPSPLGEIHVLLPFVAMLYGLWVLVGTRRVRVSQYAASTLFTAVVAIVDVAIGQIGKIH